MRLKNIIYKLSFLLLLVGLTNCTQWEEYESVSVLSAPTNSSSFSELGESTVNLNITSSADGYTSYALYEGEITSLPDGEDLLEQNVSSASIKSTSAVTANTTLTVGFSGLENNAIYTIFTVTSNMDGVVSDVIALYIQTEDYTDPTITGSTPEVSADRSQESGFDIVLSYSELIQLGDNPEFTIYYAFDDTTITVDASEISVSSNEVTISQSYPMYAGEWIWLSATEGSVLDLVGNPAPAIETGFDSEEGLYGYYWRTAEEVIDITDEMFSPAGGSAVSSLDSIIVKFDLPIYLSDEVADGDVSYTIWQDGKRTIIDVPSSYLDVVSEDSILVIYLPEAAEYGDYVSVSIAEGIVMDMYENTNAAYESDDETGVSWLISYNRDINVLVGEYTMSGTEYFTGTDTTFAITVALGAEEGTVEISGFLGSDTTIVAYFDKDFSTITFEEYTSLGDLSASSESDCILYSPYTGYTMAGFVDEMGNIEDINLGVYDYISGGWFSAYLPMSFTKKE